MHSLAHAASALEWRLPPSRCRLAASQARHHPLSRSGRRPVAQGAAAAGAAQPDQAVVVAIPGSREEAVAAASSALLAHVKGAGSAKRSKKKGFSAGGGSSGCGGAAALTRFSIELPLPTESPGDTAAFAAELLRQLQPAAGPCCVVFASQAAAAAAGGISSFAQQQGRVLSLAEACRTSGTLGGPLLLVEPGPEDVALVEQLLDEVWAGPWALVLNPTWFGAPLPQPYQDLVASFEAAYSLTITATQGLMRTEGAVLRQLPPPGRSGGSGGAGLWRVALKERGSERFVQVGALKQRPTASDLELTFINAKAATSPLTSLVKGVRGAFDRAKKGGGAGGQQ